LFIEIIGEDMALIGVCRYKWHVGAELTP